MADPTSGALQHRDSRTESANHRDDRPGISVIVMCDGMAEMLETTLHSVLAQNVPASVEILISDTGGTPEFAEQVRALKQFPWFRDLRGLDNETEPAAIAGQTSGDRLLFLRSGDILLPGALRQMSGFMDRYGFDAVIGASGRMTMSGSMDIDAGTEIQFGLPVENTISFPRGSAARVDRYLTNTSHGQVKLFRRNMLQQSHVDLRVGILHDYVCERETTRTLPEQVVLPRTHLQKATKETASTQTPGQSSDRKSIWLFAERGGNSAEENGWIFFNYCVENAHHADCYYVLNAGAKRPNCGAQLASRIVTKGSPEWSILVEQASHLFFNDAAADILASNDDVGRYEDKKYVYLTHGALAFSPGVYQRNHRYFDLITCASQEDIRIASPHWGYDVSTFRVTGLARWDRLTEFAPDKKEVLLSLTWRKTLNTKSWSDNAPLDAESIAHFKSSPYYHAIVRLLRSERLHQILRDAGLRLNIALHFRVRPLFAEALGDNSDIFRVINDDSDEENLQDLLKNAALLITDYSSVMWDMAHMNKPVILYQFDKLEMMRERGLAQFAQREPDLAFDLCFTQAEVIDMIERAVANGFQVDPSRQEHLKRFLPYRDTDNCKRILKAVEEASDPSIKYRHFGDAREAIFDDPPLDTACIDREINGKFVCAVVSDYLAHCLPGTITRLHPDSWEETLRASPPDTFLVEPNLDGRSPWAEIFFDLDATAAFLRKARQHCAETGTRLIVIDTPCHPGHIELPQDVDRIAIGFRHTATEPAVDISVIIPVFNSAEFLEDCLNSIIDQKLDGTFEIIAIDDGSTDNSLEILKRYAREHTFIRVFRQPNARQGIARNHGIHVAAGHFVTFLDADDRLAPDALANLYHTALVFDADVSVGLLGSHILKSGAVYVNQSCHHYMRSPEILDGNSWRPMLQDSSATAKLIRRKFLIDNSICFSGSYHEDAIFTSLLYSDAARISVCKKIVYVYVGRDTISGTKTFDTAKLKQILLVGSFILDVMGEKALPKETIHFKMEQFLRTYDRFLFKFSQRGASGDSRSTDPSVSDLFVDNGIAATLQRFLKHLPDQLILTYATHFGAALLLLKHGRGDLARALLEGDNRDGLAFLEQENLAQVSDFSPGSMSYKKRNTFNYYQPCRVKIVDQDEMARQWGTQADTGTALSSDWKEESFRFQVGDKIITAIQSPGKHTLTLPITLYRLYKKTQNNRREKR
ncbi:glycosyltransferase [Pukyongiella litopenaei]|nr:glycosyltransferase [Pukyongiella litopenaei]